MNEQPGPDAGKAAWRDWAAGEWELVEPSILSTRVVEHLGGFEPLVGAGTIMLYYPMPHELDLTGVVARLDDATVLTATRTPARGPLTLHEIGHSSLETHRYGFEQPSADSETLDPREIDVALVPGRCFARDGTRLGHGAGYFDEFLARVRPDAILVGVTPAGLVVDRLPRRPHDVAMTHLACELGVWAVG